MVRFWKLESLGITKEEDKSTSTYLQEYQRDCISFKDGRYSAKLPWKEDHAALPTNLNITKKRTECTIRNRSKDPQLHRKYGEIIEYQLQHDFIEKVEEEEQTSTKVHYIPHHGVKKDSTTTPIRIVYDCSCRIAKDHPSLNDCLLSTPPDLNDITSILIRFRIHPLAVSTDKEKAFLHEQLAEEDRDYTRFLW